MVRWLVNLEEMLKRSHEGSMLKLNPITALTVYYTLESRIIANVFKLGIHVQIHMMIC